jgi:hypothetical protein
MPTSQTVCRIEQVLGSAEACPPGRCAFWDSCVEGRCDRVESDDVVDVLLEMRQAVEALRG